MKHTHAHTHPHTRMCALQVDLRDVHYQIYFGNGFVKYAGIYMIKDLSSYLFIFSATSARNQTLGT